MGKIKATLPDYPTVEYEFDQPWQDETIKIWAMEQAIKLTNKDSLTHAQYAKSVRLLAEALLKEINRIH